MLGVNLEELLKDRASWIIAFDDGVPEEEREGFVAAEGAATRYGVAESLELWLPDIMDVGHIGNTADFSDQVRFATFFKFPL